MGPHRCQILGKLRELPSLGDFQDVSERHSTIIRHAGTCQMDGNSGGAKAVVLHVGQSGGGINDPDPRSPTWKRLIHTDTLLSAVRVEWGDEGHDSCTGHDCSPGTGSPALITPSLAPYSPSRRNVIRSLAAPFRQRS